jgi:DNA-binding PadR family transcriptional regulator
MRRLEKAGFLEEYSDTKDKRMRRVRMTASGKGAFFQAAQQMGAASHIVAGTLTNAQKQDLIRLLTQLDAFHHTMYAEHRMESFAEMDNYAAQERARIANIAPAVQQG